MRQSATLALAIAGMFILGTAAVSQANWYHQSGSSEGSSSEMTSPSGEPGMEAPETGTYEYQQQLETGNLPPLENSRVPGELRSSGGEPIEFVEAGGIGFRVGIDTE